MKISYIGRVEDNELVLKEDKVIICGCGKIGGKMLRYLNHKNYAPSILFFCDKDCTKVGSTVDLVEVISYEEALMNYNDACFVVANMQVNVVVDKLVRAGVKKIHIVR